MAIYYTYRPKAFTASYKATENIGLTVTDVTNTLNQLTSVKYTNYFNYPYYTVEFTYTEILQYLDLYSSTFINREGLTVNETQTKNTIGQAFTFMPGSLNTAAASNDSYESIVQNITTIYSQHIEYTTRVGRTTTSGNTTSTFNGTTSIPTFTQIGTGIYTTSSSTNSILTDISKSYYPNPSNTNITSYSYFMKEVTMTITEGLTKTVPGLIDIGTIVDNSNETSWGWSYPNNNDRNLIPQFVEDLAASFNQQTFWPNYSTSSLFLVTKGATNQTQRSTIIPANTRSITTIDIITNSTQTVTNTIITGNMFPRQTTTVSFNPAITTSSGFTIGVEESTMYAWDFRNSTQLIPTHFSYRYTTLFNGTKYNDFTTTQLIGLSSSYDTSSVKLADYQFSPFGINPPDTTINSNSTYAYAFFVNGTTTYSTNTPNISMIGTNVDYGAFKEIPPKSVFITPQQLTIQNQKFTYGTNLKFGSQTIFYPLTGQVLENVVVPILSNYSTTDTLSKTWTYSYNSQTGDISYTCYQAPRSISSNSTKSHGKFELDGEINSTYYYNVIGAYGGSSNTYGGFNSQVENYGATKYYNEQAIKGTSFNTNNVSQTYNRTRGIHESLDEQIWSKTVAIESTCPAAIILGEVGGNSYTIYPKNRIT